MMMYMHCEQNNKNIRMDYSPVIISMARALERETKEVFYTKFRQYLEARRVDPGHFKYYLKDFVTQDKSTQNLSYTKNNEWYTLAKIKYIVNKKIQKSYQGNEKPVIDYYLKDYCNTYAFKKDAFSKKQEKRELDIQNYLIQFSEQVSEIASNYRNEAAHTNGTSSLERAISFVDWILKVKQLLLNFVSKIDYVKLNNSNFAEYQMRC